jgi:hypothetical protein
LEAQQSHHHQITKQSVAYHSKSLSSQWPPLLQQCCSGHQQIQLVVNPITSGMMLYRCSCCGVVVKCHAGIPSHDMPAAALLLATLQAGLHSAQQLCQA